MKLAIEKIIYGGQGLARIPAECGPQSGMRIFVPFTLPGELVEAEIAEEHRGYCVGDVRQIERASEYRTSPPCPWFGICGGCQLQHGAYAYQVQLKREILAESLTRAGIRDLPEISALVGEPFAYRNRVRLRVRTQPEFAIGYRQAKSHRITAIDHCPIASPLLQHCIAALRALGMRTEVPVDTQEIELFTNHDQSELLLMLWTGRRSNFDEDSYAVFFTKLQTELPQLAGAAVVAAMSEKDENRSPKPLLQWGRQNLRYRVAGRDYTVSLGSFFQVNATLLDGFVNAVIGGESGATAWDLYAGVGLFSLALAERFERVLAVESNPTAGKDFRRNLQGTRAAFVGSATMDFLRKAQRREPPPILFCSILRAPGQARKPAVCWPSARRDALFMFPAIRQRWAAILPH